MEELIQQAKNGDSTAIEEISLRYKSLICSIVNKFFLVGGDKDDLWQEGMVGLFYAINNFDESKGNFSAFVKLCVEGQIITAVKKNTSDKNKPLSNYVELSELNDLETNDSPLDSLIEKERFNVLLHAVDTELTPAEKQVLSLYADGYSYEDISQKTNKSYKAVDGALQRARKKLIAVLTHKEK